MNEKSKIIRSETITLNGKIEIPDSNSMGIIKKKNVKWEPEMVKNNEYSVVSWGISATGYRITDCIFHIAAVSQQSKFSQFITIKRNMRNSYQRNIEIFRENDSTYVKNTQTQEVLETNTELTVLKDFIKWLEEVKMNDSKGIVLLYYRFREHSIAILLRALLRHNLMSNFANVVVGFVNVYDILKENCGHITKSFKLENVSQILLKKRPDISDALIRAELCLEVITTLLKNNMGLCYSTNTTMENELYAFIEPYTTKLTDEVRKFKQMKVFLKENDCVICICNIDF